MDAFGPAGACPQLSCSAPSRLRQRMPTLLRRIGRSAAIGAATGFAGMAAAIKLARDAWVTPARDRLLPLRLRAAARAGLDRADPELRRVADAATAGASLRGRRSASRRCCSPSPRFPTAAGRGDDDRASPRRSSRSSLSALILGEKVGAASLERGRARLRRRAGGDAARRHALDRRSGSLVAMLGALGHGGGDDHPAADRSRPRRPPTIVFWFTCFSMLAGAATVPARLRPAA